ncbi:MAG: hypothetical protein IJS06_05105 [Prevotella sp.]|nr:hypothetical protein [Prevotella sp.]
MDEKQVRAIARNHFCYGSLLIAVVVFLTTLVLGTLNIEVDMLNPMIAILFGFILLYSYSIAWKYVVLKAPEVRSKFYLAVSGFRFLLGGIVILVAGFILHERNAILLFAIHLLAAYISDLVFDTLYMSYAEKKLNE